MITEYEYNITDEFFKTEHIFFNHVQLMIFKKHKTACGLCFNIV